ncbi:MAG: flagellar hook capping protein [Desulfobacula sp.]|uniref:FlgD immunoglobulin-like domain containing protein n=1 Tax=Desulfobacula sp. TaxID=2593537 RepID=UPI0025B9ED3C|nr:FlgD immunoglobulin-like domain containing protein [Desulfobacula sp.]MCD4722029.1 flagellar hook capping protein [Desulfobacula sp.]
MSIISTGTTGNSSLDQITTSYQSNEKEKTQKEDALGQDAFLTMLVAQLQNQDPLNPMDGTDFSAQLAQFSQLEQLINLNGSMDSLAKSFSQNSEGDVVGYIGKQVTGNIDVMNVDKGTVSGGFYNLGQPADIMVTITDTNGKTVKTLYEGQQNSGSHIISWDGTDNGGKAVTDGSYQYTVLANSGFGFVEVPSTVTGEVDGVAYNNGKPYLVVQGLLLDPKSLTSVVNVEENNGSGSVESTLSYLGRTISTNEPIVMVEDGTVSGKELTFNLDSQQDVTLKIYDIFDELVRTITLLADDTTGGENKVEWDGLADTGYKASDGLYYYTAKTTDGFAKTPLSEEVSGIKYMNGSQYLVLNDTGRLVAISSITAIN